MTGLRGMTRIEKVMGPQNPTTDMLLGVCALLSVLLLGFSLVRNTAEKAS